MGAIERLLSIPRENSARVFLIDDVSGETRTFGEFHERAIRVAADLSRRGLKRGDRVAMLLNNSAAFADLYWGCLYAGLIWVPVNPALSGDELGFIIASSGARLLVVSPEAAGIVDQDTLTNGNIDVLCLLDTRGNASPPPEIEMWDLGALSEAPDYVPLDGATDNDIVMVVYTSGTTAQPKGVVHRIKDHYENAAAFTDHLGIGPNNRFYCNLAMTYIGGCWNLLILPYFTTSSVVLTSAFGPTSAFNYWNVAKANGVNTLWLVPTIMSMLLELDRDTVGEEFCRQSVDLALVGTAPLPAQVRERFQERYGINVHDNYALSETLFLTSQIPDGPILNGGSGTLLPGVELSLLNDDGTPSPSGEEGEIAIKSPGLMVGYYDADQQAPDVLPEGEWFRTGDVGIYSADRGLFITGRKKDVIVRGGLNVSPASVEKVLYAHPDVLECVVVGIPHVHQGEDVAAAIRIGDDADETSILREVIALAKEGLSPMKRPSKVVVLPDMPRNSTGKILKDRVRILVLDALGISEPKPD
jgi:long-chain acyl-CoA synthetase